MRSIFAYLVTSKKQRKANLDSAKVAELAEGAMTGRLMTVQRWTAVC